MKNREHLGDLAPLVEKWEKRIVAALDKVNGIDREKAQTVCNLMNLAQNKTIWALAKEKKQNENIA